MLANGNCELPAGYVHIHTSILILLVEVQNKFSKSEEESVEVKEKFTREK